LKTKSFFYNEAFIRRFLQQNVPLRPRAASSSQGSSGTDTETRTLLTHSEKSKPPGAAARDRFYKTYFRPENLGDKFSSPNFEQIFILK
jgi:hypothetical protein